MKFFGASMLIHVGAPALMIASAAASTASGLSHGPTANLVKRSIVGEVIYSIQRVIENRNVDLNGAMLKGVDGLRNMSSTIDFNKAVNQGFSNAIDQNSDLSQMAFGNVVGGAMKQLLSGIDYNSLIRRDALNFLDGSVRQVDANAVVASGLGALAAVMDEPNGAASPPVDGSRPEVKGAGRASASASAQLVTPLSRVLTSVALCTLATLCI